MQTGPKTIGPLEAFKRKQRGVAKQTEHLFNPRNSRNLVKHRRLVTSKIWTGKVPHNFCELHGSAVSILNLLSLSTE